jgi:hypothetical protein
VAIGATAGNPAGIMASTSCARTSHGSCHEPVTHAGTQNRRESAEGWPAVSRRDCMRCLRHVAPSRHAACRDWQRLAAAPGTRVDRNADGGPFCA